MSYLIESSFFIEQDQKSCQNTFILISRAIFGLFETNVKKEKNRTGLKSNRQKSPQYLILETFSIPDFVFLFARPI